MDLETIERYGQNLQKLIENPKSIRLFNETFTEGLELLKNEGYGFQFLGFGRRKLKYKSRVAASVLVLGLGYGVDLFGEDELKIFYRKNNLYLGFELVRARGHEFLSSLERLDNTGRYSKGVSLWSLDLFKPDPFYLIAWRNDSSVKKMVVRY